MLSGWDGGEGVAEPSPSLDSSRGALGIAPFLLSRKGPCLPASGFVEPPGSEQDVSLLEETIRNSS